MAVSGLQAQGDRISVSSFEVLRQIAGADLASSRAAARLAAQRHGGDCLADFRRGALAIALDRLQSAADDPRAVSGARDAAMDRLRCAPADGNAWLLLAETAAPALPLATVASYLRASRHHAPSEGWIMQRRLAFICTAAPELQDSVADLADADFTRLLAGRQFSTIAQLYEQCGEQTRRVFDRALAEAPLSLRADYARSIAARS
jgi:hypothetical protein